MLTLATLVAARVLPLDVHTDGGAAALVPPTLTTKQVPDAAATTTAVFSGTTSSAPLTYTILTGAQATPEEEGELSAFQDFVCDRHGNTSNPTGFGRSLSDGSCACKGGTTPPPRSFVTTDAAADDVGMCKSSFSTEGTVVFDSDQPDQPLYQAVESCHKIYDCQVNVKAMFGSFGPEHNDQYDSLLNSVKTTATDCLKPDRDSTDLPAPTIFLIGDSFSGALSPGVALAAKGKYQLRSFFIGTWGPLLTAGSQLEPYMRETVTNDAADATIALGEHIQTMIANEMQAGDMLVVAVAPSNIVDARYEMIDEATKGQCVSGEPSDATINRLESIITEVVEPAGGKALVLSAYNTTSLPVNRHAESWEAVQALAARHPSSMSAVSLYSLFCDAELPASSTLTDPTWVTDDAGPTCSPLVPGTEAPAFAGDEYHVSTPGAIYAWPFLCEAFDSVGNAEAGNATEPTRRR
jgi:hypothetical protein